MAEDSSISPLTVYQTICQYLCSHQQQPAQATCFEHHVSFREELKACFLALVARIISQEVAFVALRICELFLRLPTPRTMTRASQQQEQNQIATFCKSVQNLETSGPLLCGMIEVVKSLTRDSSNRIVPAKLILSACGEGSGALITCQSSSHWFFADNEFIYAVGLEGTLTKFTPLQDFRVVFSKADLIELQFHGAGTTSWTRKIEPSKQQWYQKHLKTACNEGLKRFGIVI